MQYVLCFIVVVYRDFTQVREYRDIIFIHNNLRLVDMLVDINYREKSLEWAETDIDSDCECVIVNSDSLGFVVDSQLNAYVFMHVLILFIEVKT